MLIDLHLHLRRGQRHLKMHLRVVIGVTTVVGAILAAIGLDEPDAHVTLTPSPASETMNKSRTTSRTMDTNHDLPEDDVRRALEGLRRGWEALRLLRHQTPIDSPLGAQALHVMKAIDGMAETLTYDRNHFHGG